MTVLSIQRVEKFCGRQSGSTLLDVKPLVTVIDDALPERHFETLLRGIRSLRQERIRAGYQTTFWFDFDEPPSNLIELAALQLRQHLPSWARFTGVEWWLSRMRTSNVKVDFHRDRDNALFDSTGTEAHPTVSSVLYLNECRGGLLAVTRDAPNPQNPAMAPDRHDFDLVTPAPNRFVVFKGDLTHGVLDAKNQIPGQRLPTERHWRLAIAINFWRAAPQGVGSFINSKHYRKLALR